MTETAESDSEQGTVARRPDIRQDADRASDDRSSTEEGLSSQEARRRLDNYGSNEIAQRRRPAVVEFLSHFWGPIPWMIEGAALLSGIAGKFSDLAVIVGLLLLNGVVGFWQEHQASSAIEALKQQVAARALAKRDGEWRDIAAAEVVPGDLVHIGVDQLIPADGELLDGEVSVDESALTGESLPASKGSGDDLYSGSSVSRGECSARVTATGTRTRFGRTAELVRSAAPPSHFQQAVLQIGRYLIVLSVALVALIVLVSLLRGNQLIHTLELALVVAIASIPVALPTVLSVTMAVGARALARRQAIVSRLPALEELAGVQYLLVDKTGTITRNQIEVGEAAALEAADGDDVVTLAALASRQDGNDPIDQAIIGAASNERLDVYESLETEPFDPRLKRAEGRARQSQGREFRVAKGAVQSIVELVESDSQSGEQAERHAHEFAEQGMRTLAVASTDGARWRLSGVLALRDPPQRDARQTLEQAGELGVRARMLTGDRVEIGRQVAREVGLTGEVHEADAVRHAADEGTLAEKADELTGFAQVVPEDKHRIATALQDHDRIVGMTGDGVNDTPALRRAEVGIAAAGSTDAARAASEVVLTAPGLSVIVEALRRSRETFQRMTNYATYRIAETLRLVLFVTLTIVALGFFPVTPIQVILLALLNDVAILSCAYDRAEPSAEPARWRMRRITARAGLMGIMGVVSSFLLLLLAREGLGFSEQAVQTLLFLKLSVAGHLTYFAARTRGRLWSSRPARIVLLAVIGTQVLATVIAMTGILMHPIGIAAAALAWAWSAVWILAIDHVKVLLNRRVPASA